MRDYREEYLKKLVTVDEVLSKFKDNDFLGLPCTPMEPVATLSNLHRLAGKVKNIKVGYQLISGEYRFLTDDTCKGVFDTQSIFFMKQGREAFEKGMISLTPTHLHQFTERIQKPNIYVGSASAMDRHGYFSLSLSTLWERELIESADIVILEINPRFPVTAGYSAVHISEVDCLLEVDNPLLTLPKSRITDVERAIGENIASLVNDGDTIQLGIGGIPDAVAEAFKTKKDLGVHTELLTSGIAELAELGVITNRKKTLHKDKFVASFVWGNENLYDFVDRNPAVMMMPVRYVNNPFVVAQNDNMVSINACLSVDLTGQVCSESIGSKQFSGTGGQNDMAEGAIHSKGGRSIIAMTSTAKGGTTSKIQPLLSAGSVVTLSRNNVDYIVTEYGIAEMKYKSVRERAKNLIDIAHPDFREQLTDEAAKLGYFGY